jgi:hypothetical protein
VLLIPFSPSKRYLFAKHLFAPKWVLSQLALHKNPVNPANHVNPVSIVSQHHFYRIYKIRHDLHDVPAII